MSEKVEKVAETAKEVAKSAENVVNSEAVNSIVGMMDKNVDKLAGTISGMTDKLSDFVLSNGQTAWDLLMLGGRVDAAYEMTDCIFWFFLMMVLYVFHKGFNSTVDAEIASFIAQDKEIDAKKAESVKQFSGAFLSLGKGITGFIGVTQLLDLWAVVGLFKPEIWIAKRLLEKSGLL